MFKFMYKDNDDILRRIKQLEEDVEYVKSRLESFLELGDSSLEMLKEDNKRIERILEADATILDYQKKICDGLDKLETRFDAHCARSKRTIKDELPV